MKFGRRSLELLKFNLGALLFKLAAVVFILIALVIAILFFPVEVVVDAFLYIAKHRKRGKLLASIKDEYGI